MIQKVIAFLLFITLCNNRVNSLHSEGIRGGYQPEEGTFKYQITLNVILNPAEMKSLMLCTGAIVHKFFVVTVANCVIKKTATPYSGLFFKRWYIIALGTHDLKSDNVLLDDIEEIFVPVEYDPHTNEADLAVIKLKYEIDFDEYTQLEMLELPDEETIDENLSPANVSGYGFNVLHEDRTGSSNYELKYLKANIISIDKCKSFRRVNSDNILCVKTIPNNPQAQWGICRGDVGAPLVVDKKLLGLADKALYNCVDTVFPTIYTRIKSYTPFIRDVLAGRPPPGTRRFTNPFPMNTASAISVAG